MSLRLILPPKSAVRPNDAKDPLPYYYRPWLGHLFRHRLQLGLDLIPPGGQSCLEVGVGSGILVPTLTARFPRYTGTDLTLPSGVASLVAPGCQATFVAANLLDPESLPAGTFDVAVCFSVLEHIADAASATRALARALRPGGVLVAGYPMVNLAMTQAFAAIGYRGIDRDHITSPATIDGALRNVLTPLGRAAFPPAAPVGLALYQATSWQKTG